MSDMEIRSLKTTDWSNIEALFGDNGACGGCWCMTWRLPRGGKLYEENKGSPNRRRFRQLVEEGNAHGLLAFDEGKAIGWCSVGPKSEFPKLENSRVLKVPPIGNDWAVLCFYIQRKYRGQQVATRLLSEAVNYARLNDATILDGFPARHAKGTLLPATFAWTGVPEIFEACGFQHVPRKGNTRDNEWLPRAMSRMQFRQTSQPGAEWTRFARPSGALRASVGAARLG
jgi:GNAT superfamily N-acetyltransferase